MIKINSNYKVCVLVATYNGELWIDKQIESILNQKHVDSQIFINDDFSNDCTIEKCIKLQKQNSDINIIQQPSRRGSASQNFFWSLRNVDLNNFDFIAFADQDDEWFDEKLKIAIDSLIKKKCDAYSGNVFAI